MRLRIRQNKPATLHDALRIALELESHQLSSRQRVKHVREAQLLEDGYVVQQQVSTATAREDVLQQLVDAIGGDASSLPFRRKPGSGNALTCRESGERSHLRRECPRLRKKQQGRMQCPIRKQAVAGLVGQS